MMQPRDTYKQNSPLRVLFICSRNTWRGPTAEKVFAHHPRLSVRSAGTSSSAVHNVSLRDVEWAERILCMEKKHQMFLIKKFGKEVTIKIQILDIEDHYRFMDPELVEMLEIDVSNILNGIL